MTKSKINRCLYLPSRQSRTINGFTSNHCLSVCTELLPCVFILSCFHPHVRHHCFIQCLYRLPTHLILLSPFFREPEILFLPSNINLLASSFSETLLVVKSQAFFSFGLAWFSFFLFCFGWLEISYFALGFER